MKLSDLYQECGKAERTMDSYYAIFDKNVSLKIPTINQIVETISMTLSHCIKDDDGYMYLDKVLAAITLTVSRVLLLTNITMEDREDSEDKNDYDLIFEMGIEEYLRDRFGVLSDEFDRYAKLTMETFEQRIGSTALLNDHLKSISDRLNTLEDKVSAVLESVERSNTQSRSIA